MAVFYERQNVQTGRISKACLISIDIRFSVFQGLFAGKQIGVFDFIWVGIATGMVQMPDKISWGSLYGMATLCGIGCTMSLVTKKMLSFFDDVRVRASHIKKIILVNHDTRLLVAPVISVGLLSSIYFSRTLTPVTAKQSDKAGGFRLNDPFTDLTG